MKIKIYQVNTDRDQHRIIFTSYQHIKNLITPDVYDLVYEGDVDTTSLETIYRQFNTDCPGNYQGRSMSVSDIVEIVNSHQKGFYYCDSIGFQKIEFNPSETINAIKEPEKIKVLLVNPYETPQIVEIIRSLSSYQEIVKGNIECFYPYSDEICLVCNDEGKLTGLPLNRAIFTKDHQVIDVIAGTFFICGCAGENFDSLSDDMIQKYLDKFKYPESFIRINNELKVFSTKTLMEGMCNE